jgi:hypothetical protein
VAGGVIDRPLVTDLRRAACPSAARPGRDARAVTKGGSIEVTSGSSRSKTMEYTRTDLTLIAVSGKNRLGARQANDVRSS